METLQQQLAQLTPEQVRQLLGASGHAELLQTQTQPVSTEAPPLSESALSQAEEAKQRGNEHFRNKEFALAVEAYSARVSLGLTFASWYNVCSAIDLDPRNAVCLSNRAAAYLKLQDYQSAVKDCASAIEVAPSTKPLMRRAAARIELEEYEHAVEDLIAALSFEPHNKECITNLSKIASMYSTHSVSSEAVGRATWLKAALAVASREGWKPIAVKGNPAPPALNGHTLFHGDGKKIYLFGGRSVRDQKTRVYALDNRDFSWDVVAMDGSSPSPRAWHSISCIDPSTSSMCVYGGVSSQGEDSHVYFLTPESDGRLVVWSQPQCIDGRVPSPRSGHAAVSISRDNLAAVYETFVFGGRTKSGVSGSMNILRSSKTGDQCFEGVWKEVAQQAGCWPSPRDGHTMCALSPTGGDDPASVKLVLFGGNGQQNEEKMNDTWVFDTESRQWRELECTGAIPPPRSYHTAHMIGSCMFVVGGRMRDAEDSEVYMLDTGKEGSVCTVRIVKLDRKTDNQRCHLAPPYQITVSCEWFRVPIPEKAKLTARAWHSSILTDEFKIFLLGGGTFTGPQKDAALLDLSKFAALVNE